MSVRTRTWGAISAGILAVGATGCASMRGQQQTTMDPGARQVQIAQEQSRQALEEAQEAQKRASEQAQRSAEAQQEVREAQQRLAEAQEKARTEHQKAVQAQREASAATERATARAQESQQHASQALSQRSERLERGEQVVAGQVLRATDDEVVLQPQGGGEPMTFRLSGDTQVEIAGSRGSATDILQGEDARVSYEVSGTEPRALSIQVLRGAEQPSSGQPSSPFEQPSGTAQPEAGERPRN